MCMRQNHSACDCIYIANVLSLCLDAADSGIVDISFFFSFLSITLLSARHALMCNRNCSESILKKNFLTFNNMDQANQCASVCKKSKSKSTFQLDPLLIAEKERRKRGPGSSKVSGLSWILQTLFLPLLDPLQKIISSQSKYLIISPPI